MVEGVTPGILLAAAICNIDIFKFYNKLGITCITSTDETVNTNYKLVYLITEGFWAYE